MSLYNDWKELVVYYVQTVGQQGFFEEYSKIQETAYPILLKEHNKPIKGKIKNLASELNLTPTTFMGFLDSLNTSLIAPLDLEKLEEETEIELHVNYENLFVNMVEIGAINLYTLSEWNLIFSRKELQDLIKSNGVEKTIVFPKEIGRNDACPCGSGKKFKNCCGKDK